MSMVHNDVGRVKRNDVISYTVRRASPTHRRIPAFARHYLTQVLLTGFPLLVVDVFTICAATLLIFHLYGLFSADAVPSPVMLLIFVCGAIPLIFAIYKLYPGTGLNPIIEMRQSAIATLLVFTAFVATSLIHDGRQGYMLPLSLACFLSTIMVPIMRSTARRCLSHFRWWGQPMIIFGSNSVGQRNYNYFRSRPYLGLKPIGIVDQMSDQGDRADDAAYLGTADSAPALAKKHGIYWAVISVLHESPSHAQKLIESHASHFPHVLVVPNMKGLPTLWSRACDCGGLVGIQMEANLLLAVPCFVKRSLDWSLVLTGGLLALPLLGTIAALIKISSPGPVFYRQERVGFRGRRFWIWKFRTMVQNADEVLERQLMLDPELRAEWERDCKLKNDPRITRIGRWLRKTSLDELPQIWNVLTGQMSLVGPRPIHLQNDKQYVHAQESFDLYTKVLPGITGLWQVSGRSDTTYERRMWLDMYYVRNWSPWLDAYILAKTVRVVLKCDGAY